MCDCKKSKVKVGPFLPFSYGFAWEMEGKVGKSGKTWENLHVRWSLSCDKDRIYCLHTQYIYSFFLSTTINFVMQTAVFMAPSFDTSLEFTLSRFVNHFSANINALRPVYKEP